MNWIIEFEKLEHQKDWKPLIKLVKDLVSTDLIDDVEFNIRVIYMLHILILEEDKTGLDTQELEKFLLDIFHTSYAKFKENAEYCFFLGKILRIAEWYFGLDDDLKPKRERLAFKLQETAHLQQKNNILFEWAVRFSLSDPIAVILAKQILQYDEKSISWLKSKGYPGEYVLNSLESTEWIFNI